MLLFRWRAPGRAATWVLVGALTGFACSDGGYEPLVVGTGAVPSDSAGGTGNGGAAEPGGTDEPSTGGAQGGTGGAQGGTGGRSGGTGGGGSGGGGTGGTQPELPPVTGNCSGWASRYWDCCKPHCAWRANVSGNPTRQCGANDEPLGGDPDTQQSACNGGPAYMCHGMAPWVSSSNGDLAYGFAAINNSGSVCGRCYRLQFDGSSHSGTSLGAQAIAGKQMIVQVTNVGGLEGGQFDLLIPGGGVGDFDACTSQWGTADIGERYGGFLTTCQRELGYNAELAEYKSCVAARCQAVFGGSLPELYEGCRWFVDWFEVADNPTFVYEPTTCPSELTAASGLTAQSASGCI